MVKYVYGLLVPKYLALGTKICHLQALMRAMRMLPARNGRAKQVALLALLV
jgi:hypothetical protein